MGNNSQPYLSQSTSRKVGNFWWKSLCIYQLTKIYRIPTTFVKSKWHFFQNFFIAIWSCPLGLYLVATPIIPSQHGHKTPACRIEKDGERPSTRRIFFFSKNKVHLFSKRIVMRLEKIMRLENEAASSGKKKIRPEITNLARRMFFERFEFLDASFFYLNENHLRFQLLVLALLAITHALRLFDALRWIFPTLAFYFLPFLTSVTLFYFIILPTRHLCQIAYKASRYSHTRTHIRRAVTRWLIYFIRASRYALPVEANLSCRAVP